MLFALSEVSDGDSNSNRIDMVRQCGETLEGKNDVEQYPPRRTANTKKTKARLEDKNQKISLVPTLLHFIKRCKRNSNEQYLALLVLNNISIPLENKRVCDIQLFLHIGCLTNCFACPHCSSFMTTLGFFVERSLRWNTVEPSCWQSSCGRVRLVIFWQLCWST